MGLNWQINSDSFFQLTAPENRSFQVVVGGGRRFGGFILSSGMRSWVGPWWLSVGGLYVYAVENEGIIKRRYTFHFKKLHHSGQMVCVWILPWILLLHVYLYPRIGPCLPIRRFHCIPRLPGKRWVGMSRRMDVLILLMRDFGICMNMLNLFEWFLFGWNGWEWGRRWKPHGIYMHVLKQTKTAHERRKGFFQRFNSV